MTLMNNDPDYLGATTLDVWNFVNSKTCITPQQFGAKGNGIADDTVAVQAAITFAAQSSQTIVGAPAALAANVGIRFIYNAGNTTWYRVN